MTNIAQMRSKAIRLHSKGLRAQEIAKQLGVPPLAVHSWLPSSDDESQFEMMARMRAQGMTNVEIAEHTGVSRQRVGKVLGSVRRPMKGEVRTSVRVPTETVDKAIEVADDLGITIGKSSEKYSQVVRMLDDIGDGRISVRWAPGHGPFSYLADLIESDK